MDSMIQKLAGVLGVSRVAARQLPAGASNFNPSTEALRSVIGLLGVMLAWIVPLTIFNWLYRKLALGRATTKDALDETSQRRLRTPRSSMAPEGPRHQYRYSVSSFDTNGNLIAVWQAEDAPPFLVGQPQPVSSSGFLNMAIVAVITYTVSNGVNNLRHSGAWWPDRGAWLVHVFSQWHELAMHVAGLWLLYGLVAYLPVLGAAVGLLRPRGRGFAAQVVGESALLLLPLLVMRTRVSWPWTQRLGYAMECGALFMKAHGYITANKRMAEDVHAATTSAETASAHHALSDGDAVGPARRKGTSVLADTGGTQHRDASESPGERGSEARQADSPVAGEPASAADASDGSLGVGEPQIRPRAGSEPSVAGSGVPGAEARRRAVSDESGARADRVSDGDGSAQPSLAGIVSHVLVEQPREDFGCVYAECAQAECDERARRAASLAGSGSGSGSSHGSDEDTGAGEAGVALARSHPAAASGVRVHPSTGSLRHRRSVSESQRDTLAAATSVAAPTAAAGAAPAMITSAAALPRAPPLTHGLHRLPHATGMSHAWRTFVRGVNAEGQPVVSRPQAWPYNVSIPDFLWFSFAPTLVYETGFLRTSSPIRWTYVAEKIALAAGCVIVGSVLITNHYIPVLSQFDPGRLHCTAVPGVASQAVTPPLGVFEAVSQLLLPNLLMMFIIFFTTFEFILNAAAELTHWGDRGKFYESWWDSTTFTEFSRKWNTATHTWLLRHCYLDLQRPWGQGGVGLKPGQALYATFGVSMVLHELLLWATYAPSWPFPYLGILMTTQFPLMSLLRSFKGVRLGNYVFWSGLMTGLTLVVVLYTRQYCLENPGVCACRGGGAPVLQP